MKQELTVQNCWQEALHMHQHNLKYASKGTLAYDEVMITFKKLLKTN